MSAEAVNGRRLTMQEIRQVGFQALIERLGPSGAISFLQQYDSGRGDYTRDRHTWLDATDMDEIAAAIRQRQALPEASR